jgi:pyridoxal phosphate enzyme (YggS family)
VAGIAERVAAVRDRIEAAGGDPARVTVVAVSKGVGADLVAEAVAAGVGDLGENYAQELLAKRAAVGGAPRWHFLGAIQRRKVRGLAPHVHLWHSVDRLAAGREIARRAPGAHVMVQVNVTGAPQRNGCNWEDTAELVEGLQDLGLYVRGLMCIGPRLGPRPAFRRLAETASTLGLGDLSMGMSDDLEVAVREGATIVRVGRDIFGPRDDRVDLRR